MNLSSLRLATSRSAGGFLFVPRLVIAASLALAAACLATGPARAVTIDMVTVGNPGNANDWTGYGAVNYEYRIGKYEITIGQYTAFLNAVAATDTYSLYNQSMEGDWNIAGISQIGSSGSFTYGVYFPPSSTTPDGANSPSNRPITYVSWWDAARFANWMSNGQPTGAQGPTTTENGAYDLSNWSSGTAPAMNATNPNTGSTPTYRIPTESEWYKAAYYSPTLNSGAGGYYLYATQSNATPGNTIGTGANQANFKQGGVFSVTQSSSNLAGQNYLTNVGAFTNSASYYGTFDQTGNVFEWNDLAGAAGPSRQQRGGDWGSNGQFTLASSYSFSGSPSYEQFTTGFRLASPIATVPEPSTWVMGAFGFACAGWEAWRRRKRA